MTADETRSKHDETRLRIVQRGGRRYAISVEPTYWEVLEQAAKKQGKRLNVLIAELAETDPPPRNLAARLRLFCLDYLADRLHRSRLAEGHTNIALVVTACPVPCFVVSDRRIIAFGNRAFETVFRNAPTRLIDRPLEEVFNLRFGRHLSDVWADFAAGRSRVAVGQLHYMLPGQVISAHITACPVLQTPDGGFSCLIYIGARTDRR